jgi:hypothetical protein
MNKENKLDEMSIFERLEFKIDNIFILEKVNFDIVRWLMLAYCLLGLVFNEKSFIFYGVIFLVASSAVEIVLLWVLKSELKKKYITLVENRGKI